MLNNCIFCGAKSAQWPSYASDSASKYNLCHYHMGHLLKMATVEQYTPEQHRLAGKKEKVLSGIFSECRKVLDSDNYDRETDDILSEYVKTDGFPWPESCYYGGMTPYLTLDDADVNREICRRISLLAERNGKGESITRCMADDSRNADGRCAAYSEKGSDYCNSRQCSSYSGKLTKSQAKANEAALIFDILKERLKNES